MGSPAAKVRAQVAVLHHPVELPSGAVDAGDVAVPRALERVAPETRGDVSLQPRLADQRGFPLQPRRQCGIRLLGELRRHREMLHRVPAPEDGHADQDRIHRSSGMLHDQRKQEMKLGVYGNAGVSLERPRAAVALEMQRLSSELCPDARYRIVYRGPRHNPDHRALDRMLGNPGNGDRRRGRQR